MPKKWSGGSELLTGARGQILRYMGWVAKNLCHENQWEQIRGFPNKYFADVHFSLGLDFGAFLFFLYPSRAVFAQM